ARHAVGRIADLTADKHMEGVRLTRWLLSPVPTFKLWRRMKLWELRSYEQVIKLEQDRLIYQARLQARFGRNWRRKAPVESLMPLRLAKFGVPLADTGPAGLAAAGIRLPSELERVDVRPELPAVPQQAVQETVVDVAEHHEMYEPAAAEATAGHPEVESTPELLPQFEGAYDPHHDPFPGPEQMVVAGSPATAPDGAQSLIPDEPVLPDVAYGEAVQGYLAQHGGVFPNARQFGLFLAQYGVVDPVTGGVLTEAQLRPVLQDFKTHTPHQSEPAGEQPEEGIGQTVVAHTTGARSDLADVSAGMGSFPGSATPEPATTPQPQPYGAEPVLASTASAAGDGTVGGGVPRQTAPGAGAAGAAVETEPGAWEASVTETGAATARLPKQQTQEPDLDPVQQQIILVAEWLAEAEEAGKKLSGAEVARRLELSPKTGQRRVNAAAEYLAEQRRHQGRPHLRSVSR
ncbi:DUF2637 domain-containing protein, partial [Streptomyces sp. NPDC002596]